MNNDPISKALDVTPMTQTINVPAKTKKIDSDEQFAEVQSNIRNAADVGEIALQELAQIASSSQHPRAYEVVSTLMGQIVNANKQLLEIEKLKLEIEKEKNGGNVEDPKVVNNNLFVGSTAELLEQLKSKKE